MAITGIVKVAVSRFNVVTTIVKRVTGMVAVTRGHSKLIDTVTVHRHTAVTATIKTSIDTRASYRERERETIEV